MVNDPGLDFSVNGTRLLRLAHVGRVKFSAICSGVYPHEHSRSTSITMSGRAAEVESTWEQIKKAPAFTLAVQAGFFAAGVAFILSPLMDMLVPQL